jgi:hypothetical protein
VKGDEVMTEQIVQGDGPDEVKEDGEFDEEVEVEVIDYSRRMDK